METHVTKRDWAVLLGKGTLGAIPVVGPLAAEVLGAIIPNQRLDRIESLLHMLEARLSGLDRNQIESRFRNPEFVDLLEDGMQQASRALDSMRIEHIATLLKNSIADEDLKRLQDKRLLALLGELNDVEIMLLNSYTLERRQDLAFNSTHRHILSGPLESSEATQEHIDAAAIYAEYHNHLVRLGLLNRQYRTPHEGEWEIDENTGTLEAAGHTVTPLGRLLLRRIDLLKPGER